MRAIIGFELTKHLRILSKDREVGVNMFGVYISRWRMEAEMKNQFESDWYGGLALRPWQVPSLLNQTPTYAMQYAASTT